MNATFKIAAVLLTLAGAATPRNAAAWGDDGHVVIGTIAYSLLDPAVKAKVDAMLASDGDTLTAPDFASRATWADKFRESNRGIGRMAAASSWHYTNIQIADGNADRPCAGHPPLPAGLPASEGPQSCAIDKVEQFTAELANPATMPQERLLALKFLLHLVGDLHQPLHSADNNDHGGNGINVVSPTGNYPISLHSYWDTEVLNQMTPFGTQTKKIPAAHRLALETVATQIWKEYSSRQRDWVGGRPRDWALDAFTKARDIAYRLPQTPVGSGKKGEPVYRLEPGYEKTAVTTSREQIAKAGLRLAGLLNGALR